MQSDSDVKYPHDNRCEDASHERTTLIGTSCDKMNGVAGPRIHISLTSDGDVFSTPILLILGKQIRLTGFYHEHRVD